MKNRVLFLASMAIMGATSLKAQLNVGSTSAADPSAILQATSTTKGFLPPSLTTTQRDSVSNPATGLIVFNNSLNQLQINVGTPVAPVWTVTGGLNAYWSAMGNTGTVPGTNYLGTTDNAPLGFRTNGVERMRIDSTTGFVGIGTGNPFAPLQFPNTVVNRKIVLWDAGTNADNDSSFYGFGINAGKLRYQVPVGSSHSFYNNKILTTNINAGGITQLSGNTSANTSILLGRLGGEGSLSVAGSTTQYIQASVPGDMVLRSDTGSLFVGPFGNKPLILFTNNAEKMRINPAGNVGIGTTPDSSAILQLASTTMGFLPPSMTITQRSAIVKPAIGLIIFNTTTNQLEVNTGTTVAPVWGSSGIGTIYTGDGSLTTTRNVALNNHQLNFVGTQGNLTIDSTGNYLRTNANSLTLSESGSNVGPITMQLANNQTTGMIGMVVSSNNLVTGSPTIVPVVDLSLQTQNAGTVATKIKQNTIRMEGRTNFIYGHYNGGADTTELQMGKIGNPALVVSDQYAMVRFNLGIGTGTDTIRSPLTITSNSNGAKITLWDGGHSLIGDTSHLGFGVSGGQMNYDVGWNNSHVFYTGGKNGTGIEQMRINNTGVTVLRRLNIGDTLSNINIGVLTGVASTGTGNMFLGIGSGQNNTIGANNVFTGYQSGNNNTTGTYNSFSGYQSGINNTIGFRNTFAGSQSGYLNTTGINNQFFGWAAGFGITTGNGNIAIGGQSGNSLKSGSGNIFIGYQAGFNDTVGYNQFIGFQSGLNNISGTSNNFSGYQSGYNNTVGSRNNFNGYQSGINNISGNDNTFTGNQSGYSNNGTQNTFTGSLSGYNTTTASQNTFTGYNSGNGNTTGNFNVFTGLNSGNLNTTGSGNSFYGLFSGNANTTGSNNTAFGFSAGPQTANLSNTVSIGNNAQATISNTVVLGNNFNVGIGNNAPNQMLTVGSSSTNNTSPTVILMDKSTSSVAGQKPKLILWGDTTASQAVGLGVSGGQLDYIGAPGNSHVFYTGGIERMRINSNTAITGNLTYTGTSSQGSDRRLKRNIVSLNSALGQVMQLLPYTYDKKASIAAKEYTIKEIGFIAQDVRKILPQLVTEGTDADKTLSVNYIGIIPILTKAIQEQQVQYDTQVALSKAQQAEIALLKKQNQSITAQLAEMKDLKIAMAAMQTELSKIAVVNKIAATNTASK